MFVRREGFARQAAADFTGTVQVAELPQGRVLLAGVDPVLSQEWQVQEQAPPQCSRPN